MPFYQGRKDFGFRYPTRRVYCTSPKRFVEKGDTLVSVRAPVGDINMVEEKCSIGRGGWQGYDIKQGNRSYTYYTIAVFAGCLFSLRSRRYSFLEQLTKRTSKHFSYLRPPDEIVEAFERLVFSLDQNY